MHNATKALKNILIPVLILWLVLLNSCTPVFTENSPDNDQSVQSENESADLKEITEDGDKNTMKLQINNNVLTVNLEDNTSSEALKDLISQEPLTIKMQDYGNMEKVGPVGTRLPENNEQITAQAGDIILYQGNALVIYYKSNSWNFTKIGRIEDVTQDELKTLLGSGNVSVTLFTD
jgi:hypothetical protein